MTPAVRRLLREHGLTAAMIAGTGGGGRITREDVTDYVESQRTGQPVGAPERRGGACRSSCCPGRPSSRGVDPAPRPPPRRVAGAGAAPAPRSPAARHAGEPDDRASPKARTKSSSR